MFSDFFSRLSVRMERIMFDLNEGLDTASFVVRCFSSVTVKSKLCEVRAEACFLVNFFVY